MPRRQSSTATIEARIVSIRGLSVMLDVDLAELYGVAAGHLLRAVRRNSDRFPPDFWFQLTNQELAVLKCQNGISSSSGHGGRRHRNWAFTEQGVAMLSSVLKSTTAAQLNVEIMRAFVRLRRAALASQQLMPLIEDLSKRVDSHDAVISDLIDSIRQLVEGPGSRPSRPIGFTADIDDKK